jgi:hypothetical protein
MVYSLSSSSILLALQTTGGYNILDAYLGLIDLKCLQKFGWEVRGKNPLQDNEEGDIIILSLAISECC